MLAWPLRVVERADLEPFGKAVRRFEEAPASAIGPVFSGRDCRAVVSGKVHDDPQNPAGALLSAMGIPGDDRVAPPPGTYSLRLAPATVSA